MPKTMPKTNPQHTDPMIAMLAQMQSAGLGTVSMLGAAWAEAAGEAGEELARFAQTRMRHDLALGQDLMHCKDLAEVGRIQSAFLRKAAEQYMAEGGRLVSLAGFVPPMRRARA